MTEGVGLNTNNNKRLLIIDQDNSSKLFIRKNDLNNNEFTYLFRTARDFMRDFCNIEFEKNNSKSAFCDGVTTAVFNFVDDRLKLFEDNKDLIISTLENIQIPTQDKLNNILSKTNTLKKDSEVDILKKEVTHLIAAKKREEATESIVNQLKKDRKFYALRDDDRKEIWIYEEGIYVPNGATYIQEFCREVFEELYTAHLTNNVIDKVRADSYIKPEDFFQDDNIEELAVENGILNLRTKKLEDFTEKKIFFNKLPVSYDNNKDCPKIKQFLRDILEHDKDYLVIQELFGDLLYKDYKFERCFMFLGDGRNGKSKLGELMKMFLGVKNVCNIHPQALQDPDNFSLQNFFGKMANLSLDINSTALKDIGILKSLSGRDVLSANRKNKSHIEFRNYAKLIYGSNQLPTVYETQNAFWERWILLHFPYTFISKDRYNSLDSSEKYKYKIKDADIINKISSKDELSGLLNFALQGFDRLNNNNRYSYRYSPEEVKIFWTMRSNSFNAFLMKYLEVDYGAKLIKKDLRMYYIKFCNSNKLKTVSDKAIKRILFDNGCDEGFSLSNSERVRYWDGLKLKEEFETVDAHGYSKMESVEKELIKNFNNKIVDDNNGSK